MAATSEPTTTIDIGAFIVRKPGTRGGRPHVVGAGVTVKRLVGMRYIEGLTPEQIVDEMPHLTLTGVYAALTYYHANKARMDAEFASEDAEDDRIEQEWLRSQGRA